MYKYFFIVSLFLVSCAGDTKQDDYWVPIDRAMDAQVNAWNNGDIHGFMSAYWKSDSLLFIGKRGVNRGWETTLNNYLSSYPDKQAMGELKFTTVEKIPIDLNHAFMIGKWELFREKDTLSGHYSLLWKRMNGHWRIKADHSS